ncbi:hypothetical protein H4Q26_016942 [Puccinia striiformis f. sp. tritici PST-130]|nr:hypothetical protein H4Q26_016942 [Puccinia striiformis f. sp. tritici PST-130]
MLRDRARDDFKLAKTEGTAPNTWESFKRWITRANPISPSKRSVAKAGDSLHQGPNEALDHFMKRFSTWQTQAKTYGLLYDEGLTFVLKLNAPLSKKLDKIMATLPAKLDRMVARVNIGCGHPTHTWSSAAERIANRLKPKGPGVDDSLGSQRPSLCRMAATDIDSDATIRSSFAGSATEERRRFPMSFRDIQNAVIDENSRLPAQNLASTSATSKRSSGAGQSGSGKKTKGEASDQPIFEHFIYHRVPGRSAPKLEAAVSRIKTGTIETKSCTSNHRYPRGRRIERRSKGGRSRRLDQNARKEYKPDRICISLSDLTALAITTTSSSINYYIESSSLNLTVSRRLLCDDRLQGSTL